MAQKTVVTLIDDLDDGKADETVTFGIDGSSYEIDLSAKNAAALRDALANYVANARRASGRSSRTSGGTARRAGRPARGDREQTQAIREWARTHDYKVGEKGRIPAPISARTRRPPRTPGAGSRRSSASTSPERTRRPSRSRLGRRV